MGTYTTNYNLFMPSVGEQGWGTLVNGNFSMIDTTMKSLSNRLTTCESTDVAYNTRITALEAGEFEGTINGATITSTSFNGVPIVNSGTLTVTPVTNGDFVIIPNNSDYNYLLPINNNVFYSGSIVFKNIGWSYDHLIYYTNGLSESTTTSFTVPKNSGTYTFKFTNIPYFGIMPSNTTELRFQRFIIS